MPVLGGVVVADAGYDESCVDVGDVELREPGNAIAAASASGEEGADGPLDSRDRVCL